LKHTHTTSLHTAHDTHYTRHTAHTTRKVTQTRPRHFIVTRAHTPLRVYEK
jgi:hypothetical protein